MGSEVYDMKDHIGICWGIKVSPPDGPERDIFQLLISAIRVSA